MNYPIEIYAIVLLAVAFDVVTGFTQAVYNKTVSSSKLRSGAYHKLSYVFLVALSLFVEYGMQYMDLGIDAPVFMATAGYLVLTESVSIVENISKINPELLESPIFNLLAQNQKRRKEDKENDARD